VLQTRTGSPGNWTDRESRIVAFANRIPSFARNEATIDLMRHRLEVEYGSMDFLFIRIMDMLCEDG
jgi:phosphatidylglycerol lysyltransferase